MSLRSAFDKVSISKKHGSALMIHKIKQNFALIKFTKHACSENLQLLGVTYTYICPRIRHVVKDPPIQHERTAKVCNAYNSSRECQIGSRRDQTLLAKVRTGKYKELCAYKSLLDISLQSGAARSSAMVTEMPSDRET